MFGFFLALGHPRVSTKNVSPICPAVWPAIGNIYICIYMYVLFYYIDDADIFRYKLFVIFALLFKILKYIYF